MIVVDSSVWIDYLREVDTRQTTRLDQLLGYDEVATGDLVMTEVLQGFSSERAFKAAYELLLLGTLLIVGSRDVALLAARHYRFLRARGITPRKTIDTLIVTRCIMDGLPLLYSDRDFDPFVEHLGLRSALDLPIGPL